MSLRSLFTLGLTALLMIGCAKKEAEAKVVTNAPLPADVQSVAATADPASSQTASPGTTAETTPVAANGSLQISGEFISPMTSELAAKIQGRVSKLFVSEGQRVSAGQPVLQLDTDYSAIDLQRAQADQARAASAESDARRDLDRKTELHAKGSVPQAMFDRSQAAYDQARAMRAASAAAVASARQRLADSTLRAPFDGVVVEKRAEVGERLGDNSIAMVVAQTSPLKLRFNLPERYIDSVHTGQLVRATVEPFPTERFDGRVSVVAQVVDPKTRSFFVEALFPNKDRRLRPGLFARVELDVK